MKNTAVIFDMDGVIFDTERLIQKCWKIVADRHEIPDIEDTCMKCTGVTMEEAEQIYLQRYGKDFPYYKFRKEAREIFWGEMYGEHFPIKKGVVSLLEALKRNQIPIALATSTYWQFAEKELRDAKLISYFDVIVCGDMVQKSKPDPEIFLKACEVLSAIPKSTYVIEDSKNGIIAAFQGGFQTIMVPDLIAPTEELKEKTVQICESLTDVMNYLTSMQVLTK